MGKAWNIAKIAAILGLAALVLIASAVLLLGQNVSSAYPLVTDCPGGCVPVAVPTSIEVCARSCADLDRLWQPHFDPNDRRR